MFEGGSGSAHHVEDVGRILLQVQDNLRGLRESLRTAGAGPGGAGGGPGAGRHDTRAAANTVAQLDTVLERAEHDLRMKAEVVLNSVIQNTVRTLPSIRKPSSAGSAGTGGGGRASGRASLRATAGSEFGEPRAVPPAHARAGGAGGATSPSARRRTLMARTRPKSDPKPASRVRDRMLEAQAFSHFDIHNEDHRRFLRTKYGVPFKDAAQRLDARVNQRSAGVRKHGRRQKNKLTQPAGLLPLKNRRDPLAAPPPVTDADVNKGILSLINRGLLPSTIDVTAAFREGRSVVQNPVRMHDWAEQFVPTAVYTSPFGFSAASVKLDLAPPAREPAPATLTRTLSGSRRAPAARPPQRKAHRQTLEYSGPLAPNPIRKPRGQPTLPPRAAAPESPPPRQGEGDTAAEEELRQAVDKIRGYNELLDEFSLHQFIIRRGRVLDTTPEFRSFKRTHAGQWGPITIIISALERLLSEYSVPTAYVDGQAVAQLASDELASANPTTEALLQCIANIDQVAPLLKLPGQRFVGKHGRVAAATAIQATFRMYLCRLMYLGRQSLSAAAHTIQHAWRGFADARRTRTKLREAQLEAEDRWVQMMDTFRRRWPQIQRRRRVVIHIPSISAEEHVRWGIPHFSTRQNLQMARLCAIADPLVDVIYVAPFALTDDLRSYYQKLLAVGGVDDVSHRFKVVVPENMSRFPTTISLTSAVLYSPRCLRRIKHFARGKEAYIVPGVVGPEDKRLSMLLNIPMLAAEPSLATLYSTKSGSKRIFAMADVNTPPGAHDIYEEEEVFAALTKLIAANTHVKRWIFKVDDEFGGRGHAYLDVGGLKVVQSLRRQRESMTEAKWADPEVQAAAAQQVMEALQRNLARRVTIVVPTLYPSWAAYLKAFTRLGGVIEAATDDTLGNPSVNLFIAPSGTVQVTSTHEQLFAQPYRQIGAAFPQQSVPYQALAGAATAIGQVLRKQGVMGYVGIDFVTFWDKAVGSQRLWAVDLNLRLTSTACSFALFNFLMSGELDTDTGLYIVDTKNRPSTTASARESVVSRRTAASYDRVGALLGERPGSSASSAFGGDGSALGGTAPLGSDSVMSSARSVRPPSAATSVTGAGAGAGSGGGGHSHGLMPGFAYRSYVSHDYLFHPNLSSLQYAAFFNLCRLQGISFDLHERVGTAFVLVDSLAGGIIGMLSVGRNPVGASKSMQKSLEFIAAQVGARAPVSEFDDEASNFQDILTSTKKRSRALANR